MSEGRGLLFDPKVVSAGVGSGCGTIVSLKIGHLAYRFFELSYGIPLQPDDKDAIIVVVSFICSFAGAVIGALTMLWLRNLKIPLNGQSGIGLIELLLVMGILGILGSISIPQFQNYRRRAFDASARSDLRNAAIAEEAYYSDHGTYTESMAALRELGLRISPRVEVQAIADRDRLTLVARATSCAPGTGLWVYSVTTGTIEGETCK